MKPYKSTISYKKYKRVLENQDKDAIEYVCLYSYVSCALAPQGKLNTNFRATYCKHTNGWFYYTAHNYVTNTMEYIRSCEAPIGILVPIEDLKYTPETTTEEYTIRTTVLPSSMFKT